MVISMIQFVQPSAYDKFAAFCVSCPKLLLSLRAINTRGTSELTSRTILNLFNPILLFKIIRISWSLFDSRNILKLFASLSTLLQFSSDSRGIEYVLRFLEHSVHLLKGHSIGFRVAKIDDRDNRSVDAGVDQIVVVLDGSKADGSDFGNDEIENPCRGNGHSGDWCTNVKRSDFESMLVRLAWSEMRFSQLTFRGIPARTIDISTGQATGRQIEDSQKRDSQKSDREDEIEHE